MPSIASKPVARSRSAARRRPGEPDILSAAGSSRTIHPESIAGGSSGPAPPRRGPPPGPRSSSLVPASASISGERAIKGAPGGPSLSTATPSRGGSLPPPVRARAVATAAKVPSSPGTRTRQRTSPSAGPKPSPISASRSVPYSRLHRRVEEGDRRLGRLAQPFASRGRPPPRRQRRRRVGRPGPSKEPDQPLALPVGPDETNGHRGARGGMAPGPGPIPTISTTQVHRCIAAPETTRPGRAGCRPGASMPSPHISSMDCTNTNGRRMPVGRRIPRDSGQSTRPARGGRARTRFPGSRGHWT